MPLHRCITALCISVSQKIKYVLWDYYAAAEYRTECRTEFEKLTDRNAVLTFSDKGTRLEFHY